MEDSSFLTSLDGIGNYLQLAGFSKTKDFLLSPYIPHTECIENVKRLLNAVLYGSNVQDKVYIFYNLLDYVIRVLKDMPKRLELS